MEPSTSACHYQVCSVTRWRTVICSVTRWRTVICLALLIQRVQAQTAGPENITSTSLDPPTTKPPQICQINTCTYDGGWNPNGTIRMQPEKCPSPTTSNNSSVRCENDTSCTECVNITTCDVKDKNYDSRCQNCSAQWTGQLNSLGCDKSVVTVIVVVVSLLFVVLIVIVVIWFILRTKRHRKNRRPPPTLPAKDDLDIRPGGSSFRRSRKGNSTHREPESKREREGGEIPLTRYNLIPDDGSASPRGPDLSPAGRPSRRLNRDEGGPKEEEDSREGYVDMKGLNKVRDAAKQAAGAKHLTKPAHATTPSSTPKGGRRAAAGHHEPSPSRTPATTTDRSEVLSDYQNVDGVPSTPSGELTGSRKDGKPNYQNVRDKEMTSYINNRLKLSIVPTAPSTSDASLNTPSYKPKSSSPALPRAVPKTAGVLPPAPGDGRNLYTQLVPDSRMSTSSDTYGGVGDLGKGEMDNDSSSPDLLDDRSHSTKVLPRSPKPTFPLVSKSHNRQPSDTLPRMVPPISSMSSIDNNQSTSLPRQASSSSISSLGHPRSRPLPAVTPPPPAPHNVRGVPGYVNQKPLPSHRPTPASAR